MATDWAHVASPEHRTEPRDEVHHRARATDIAAGCPLPMLIVNMSPHGMMARCEVPLSIGDRLRIVLPAVGARVAEVRWALGGRIGCQFDQPVAIGDYVSALSAMR
ncbi:PilZ domain-containing protein [Sphingomonas bacterium]|uniref:PilZ domain-containing protein n=1 Tax=Sphingomonas bacterium TaxID=1895847 RepID=UPI0015765D43|nr:PilZ domain-containing protein [Sphingomonas bacterium]